MLEMTRDDPLGNALMQVGYCEIDFVDYWDIGKSKEVFVNEFIASISHHFNPQCM